MIPVILLLFLAYVAPLPPVGGCPHHGPRCVHGSSCPAAKRQLAEQAATSCHTSHHGDAGEMTWYKCSISTCHGDAVSSAGWDANFIVNLEKSTTLRVSSTMLNRDSCLNDHPSSRDISEPPEGILLS